MRPVAALILKITLVDTRPAVWRQVIVPADIPLARLHPVIQTAMGWSDSCPYYFADQAGRFYATNSSGGSVQDARRIKLQKILRVPRDCLRYVYNSASRWEHSVALESVTVMTKRPFRAKCLDGARRCPPEDCASASDFAVLLKRLSGNKRANNEPMGYCRGWIDGPFQPEEFDRTVISAYLRRVKI